MLIEFDVNVSAISVSRFVDRRTWNVDEEGLIGAVADGGSAGEEQLVRQSISRLAVIDSWYIARGHDLVALLRIGFQNVIGSISAGIGVEQIERVLRSGISREDFEATGMVERIREWELENVPYEIL